jgi:hypothetical protein
VNGISTSSIACPPLEWTVAILALALMSLAPVSAASVHGLWVWKGPVVLGDASGARKLLAFCQEHEINEVYIALASHGAVMADERLVEAIKVLHASSIRVEALLSSENADEAGPHREKLLRELQDVLAFNRRSPHARFDGVHLDIEPQQRPENKGSGNLRFLPGLVETYRASRAEAESAGLTVNADIQNKLLQGTLEERRLLLGSLPRVTLMMFELSAPAEARDERARAIQVQRESQKFLSMAYADLDGTSWAKMVIALRTPDYGAQVGVMLAALESAADSDAHFLGWALHSYNNSL